MDRSTRGISQRPAIPNPLKRRVLVEAGHRCAIPTCKQPTTEIAHIVPWATCQKHEFENLIALCPNCHTRYDRHEIDVKAMKAYKANLGVLSGRYSDFERRVLEQFAQSPGQGELRLPVGYRLLVWYLLRDGLLREPVLDASVASMLSGDVPIAGVEIYRLSPLGTQFVAEFAAAHSLCGDVDEDDAV